MWSCEVRRRPARLGKLERVAGIEPARSAWEADRLPLHHTRAAASLPRKPAFGQSLCVHSLPAARRPTVIPSWQGHRLRQRRRVFRNCQRGPDGREMAIVEIEELACVGVGTAPALQRKFSGSMKVPPLVNARTRLLMSGSMAIGQDVSSRFSRFAKNAIFRTSVMNCGDWPMTNTRTPRPRSVSIVCWRPSKLLAS